MLQETHFENNIPLETLDTQFEELQQEKNNGHTKTCARSDTHLRVFTSCLLCFGSISLVFGLSISLFMEVSDRTSVILLLDQVAFSILWIVSGALGIASLRIRTMKTGRRRRRIWYACSSWITLLAANILAFVGAFMAIVNLVMSNPAYVDYFTTLAVPKNLYYMCHMVTIAAVVGVVQFLLTFLTLFGLQLLTTSTSGAAHWSKI